MALEVAKKRRNCLDSFFSDEDINEIKKSKDEDLEKYIRYIAEYKRYIQAVLRLNYGQHKEYTKLLVLLNTDNFELSKRCKLKMINAFDKIISDRYKYLIDLRVIREKNNNKEFKADIDFNDMEKVNIE